MTLKYCLDGDLTQFEVQTLGRLLCGLSEHSWHRIPKEIFLSVLPQILPLNCHIDATKVFDILFS